MNVVIHGKDHTKKYILLRPRDKLLKTHYGKTIALSIRQNVKSNMTYGKAQSNRNMEL